MFRNSRFNIFENEWQNNISCAQIIPLVHKWPKHLSVDAK